MLSIFVIPTNRADVWLEPISSVQGATLRPLIRRLATKPDIIVYIMV